MDALKAKVLANSSVEERVEVNQRHLIDKILARYSAEFTVYRELLQNANDAEATHVEIEFTTATIATNSHEPSTSDNNNNNNDGDSKLNSWITSKEKCHTVTFRNNGRDFSPVDWQRLKKIAEGNPDEQKIGFFGVGFYSLFSMCEEPFVVSGKQCMAFFWKGDQLFTKHTNVGVDNGMEGERAAWTSFLMTLRDAIDAPDIPEFGRFLATSMMFTSCLTDVAVSVNGMRVIHLSKKMADCEPVETTHFALQPKSPRGIFELLGATTRQVQLSAEYLKITQRWWTGTSTSMERATVFMRMAQSQLRTHVPDAMVKQMEHATKKRPPKNTAVQMMYAVKADLDVSRESSASFPLFSDLLPFPRQGKVFIGFATHQTTGIAAHLAAHLIPTVERESIDFVDKVLSVWNMELLTMCAQLARIVYNMQLDHLRAAFVNQCADGASEDSRRQPRGVRLFEMDAKGNVVGQEDPVWLALEEQGIHAMQMFAPKPSTPAPHVGQLIKNGFVITSKLPLPVLTCRGVVGCTEARKPRKDMLHLLRTTAYLSPRLVEACQDMCTMLTERELLREMTVEDLVADLKENGRLADTEVATLLRWWMTKATSRDKEDHEASLRAVTVLANEQTLRDVTVFPNASVIDGLPMPRHCLPTAIARPFHVRQLQSCFREQWRMMTMVEWVRATLPVYNDKQTITPQLAEKVLHAVSRTISTLDAQDQALIFSMLLEQPCVPTNLGLRKPKQSYLKRIGLFEDLPHVHMDKPVADRFLTNLGVREHVELNVILDRLHDLKWDMHQLIRYLSANRHTLSDADMQQLKENIAFEAEPPGNDYGTERPANETTKSNASSTRHRVDVLHAPLDELRTFGVPVLAWNASWRAASPQAKFLVELGLRTHLHLNDLLRIAATTHDADLRNRLLTYFCDHYRTLYQHEYDPVTVREAFLPCIRFDASSASGSPTPQPSLATPRDCFADASVRVLGFSVLAEAWVSEATRFGVQRHPSARALVDRLLLLLSTRSAMLQSVNKARAVFEYLASRQAEFGRSEWNRLKQMEFIPVMVTDKDTETATHKRPGECFFAGRDLTDQFDARFFTFVDFGDVANAFLRACGVQQQPTAVDLARAVVARPRDYYERVGTGQRYLDVLRFLAAHEAALRADHALWAQLKNTPFLLASRSRRQDGEGGEKSVTENELHKAANVVLIDDTVMQRVFQPWSAPMETVLEKFYQSLGSPFISSLIKESYRVQGTGSASATAKQLQTLIHCRAPLLVCDFHYDHLQRLTKDANQLLAGLVVQQVHAIHIQCVYLPTGQTNLRPAYACLQRARAPPSLLERLTLAKPAPASTDISQDTLYIAATESGKENGASVNYFDVATALCKLVFRQPRLNDALLMSTLLSTSEAQLRERGFPVDRILTPLTPPTPSTADATQTPPKPSNEPPPAAPRQNSEPAGTLEKREPVQQQPIQQQQQQKQQTEEKVDQSERPAVPSEPSEDLASKESTSLLPTAAKQNRNRLSKWAERIRVPWANPMYRSESSTASNEDRESTGSGGDPPPPYGQVNGSKQAGDGSRTALQRSTLTSPGVSTEDGLVPDAESHARLGNTLRQSIASCRPHSHPTIHTDARQESYLDRAAEEADAIFDCTPAQHIAYHAKANDIDVYLATSLNDMPVFDNTLRAFPDPRQDNTSSSTNGVPPSTVRVNYTHQLRVFVSVLDTLARDVFEAPKHSVHVFFDPLSTTTAFNVGHSLFFNLRAFIARQLADGETNGGGAMAARAGNDRVTRAMLSYWFLVFCHELAHNFVGPHDVRHEFYLSAYAEHFMPNLMDVLQRTDP